MTAAVLRGILERIEHPPGAMIPTEGVSLYEGLDLERNDDLMRAVQVLFSEIQRNGNMLGGLDIYAENAAPTNSEDLGGWRFMFSHQHLTNVIWFQAFQALVRKSLIRNCRNNQCSRPNGLFNADRPNQYYCSVTCRNYHNTVAHRAKISQKNIDDLLPGTGIGGPR